MLVFIDTSSLIKRYIQEDGSDKIDNYFVDGNEILLSPITTIEIASTFNRKLRDRTISLDTMDKAKQLFNIDYNSYNIIAFYDILMKSIELINQYPLKTLDSIQTASAIISRSDVCLTSDVQLFNIWREVKSLRSVFI